MVSWEFGLAETIAAGALAMVVLFFNLKPVWMIRTERRFEEALKAFDDTVKSAVASAKIMYQNEKILLLKELKADAKVIGQIDFDATTETE